MFHARTNLKNHLFLTFLRIVSSHKQVQGVYATMRFLLEDKHANKSIKVEKNKKKLCFQAEFGPDCIFA